MYKRLNEQMIVRLEDGAAIPNDPGNVDFRTFQEFLLAGGNLLPPDPAPAKRPEVVKLEQDKAAVKQQARLAALVDMTPAEVTAWVSSNVKNLEDAKELLAALAVAVSILARNF